MNEASDGTRNLRRLLKRLTGPDAQVPDAGDPIGSMVMSFLLWNAELSRALAAFRRLREAVVDFNDLRVCLAHETAMIIGERYPLGRERCQRLRASLNDLYAREHAVDLGRVATLGKREIKRYVESLDGMLPYVSTRVCLVSFDIHGIPVDDLLRQALIDADMAAASTDANELSQRLTRQVPSGDGLSAHWALESWADRKPRGSGTVKRGVGAARAGSSRRSGTARRTASASGAGPRRARAAVKPAPGKNSRRRAGAS